MYKGCTKLYILNNFFFSCHLRIIRSPTTNSFISYTLFNSHITIQILILIMMFREKFCFYVLYHFLNQTIENMIHTSYVAHNVCIWMKFAPLYKGVILIVQDKCSIGQDKCSNYTRQMFNFFFLSCHLRIAHSQGTYSSITHSSYTFYLTHT